MNKKLVVFDVDGTLLDSKKNCSTKTIEALSNLQKNGHIVTIATGRGWFYSKTLINFLNLKNYILCNGAAAYLNQQEVYHQPLDSDEFKQAHQLLNNQKIDIIALNSTTLKRLSSHNLPMMQQAMATFGGNIPDLDSNFLQQEQIYQGMAFYKKESSIDFEQNFKKLRFVRWHQNSVDIVAKNGSKATTMLKLAEKLNIDNENIIAFGDGLNDREMLKTAGIGIAMGNAETAVKNQADLITRSNDQDGIWYGLKELSVI